MTDSRSYDVFLSYAAADRGWVAEFGEALRQAGVTSFFDVYALPPGSQWTDRLFDALRASRTVIVIISRHSVKAPWTFFEVGAAIADGKRLIPVIIEDVELESLPPFLQNYMALREESPTEAGRRVADAIGQVPAQ